MWEFFLDEMYYGEWAVRRVGDTDFRSQYLFHVTTQEEAMALSALLNGYELGLTTTRLTTTY